MNDNNKHQNNSDVVSPEQADKTWSELESGDRLGQAIRDSLDSRLPQSDPKLREVLLARLPVESPIDQVTVRGKTSSGGSGRMLIRWVLAAGLVVGLASIAWLGQLNYSSYSMSRNTFAESDREGQPDMLRQAGDRRQSLSRRAGGQAARDQDSSGSYSGDLPEGVISIESGPGPFGGTMKIISGIAVDESSGEEVANSLVFPPNQKSEMFTNRAQGSGQLAGSTGKPVLTGIEPLITSVTPTVDNDGEGSQSFNYQFVPGEPGVLPQYSTWGPKGVDRIVPTGLGDGRENESYDFSGESLDLIPKLDRDAVSYGEQYDAIYENEFLSTQGLSALSTFSIDVDTASYANIRRFLTAGQLPPPNAVRIEELVNYFQYEYPQPTDDVPFSVNMEVATCPWNSRHRLLRIGLKGKEIHREERPVSNLVFLLDVSGSMSDANKLPLLKRGLQMMVDQLGENDRVTIVTYAGNAGLALPPTRGDQKQTINAAIDSLQSGGSTHGSAGIKLAYELAGQNFIEGGTNRVIWATDGDLNVGVTDDQQLVDLVSTRAKGGVFLTLLGFGTGNLKDSKMEKIADKGNGVYAYIDSMREARKVLVEQMSGSLVTIARDVKLQIEFNPGQVAAYRLIGYENRMLATEDFDDDRKDAGEIGAGHTVTALYELVPAGDSSGQPAPINLKYQTSAAVPQANNDATTELSDAANDGDLLTLALRYKLPEASESTKVEFTVADSGNSFESASTEFRFAASVASFGMILRGSRFRGDSSIQMVEQIASSALGSDTQGYRAEFVDLVRRVRNR